MNKKTFWAKDDICNKLFDDPKIKIEIDGIKLEGNKIKLEGHIIQPPKRILIKLKRHTLYL